MESNPNLSRNEVVKLRIDNEVLRQHNAGLLTNLKKLQALNLVNLKAMEQFENDRNGMVQNMKRMEDQKVLMVRQMGSLEQQNLVLLGKFNQMNEGSQLLRLKVKEMEDEKIKNYMASLRIERDNIVLRGYLESVEEKERGWIQGQAKYKRTITDLQRQLKTLNVLLREKDTQNSHSRKLLLEIKDLNKDVEWYRQKCEDLKAQNSELKLKRKTLENKKTKYKQMVTSLHEEKKNLKVLVSKKSPKRRVVSYGNRTPEGLISLEEIQQQKNAQVLQEKLNSQREQLQNIQVIQQRLGNVGGGIITDEELEEAQRDQNVLDSLRNRNRTNNTTQ